MNKYIYFLFLIFIASFESNAQNIEWLKSFGGAGHEKIFESLIDKDNNIITLGTFEDTVDFNSGPDTNYIYTSSMYNIFLLKSDSLGNFLWVRHIGGRTDYNTISMVIDSSNNILVSASFFDTFDIDFGAGVHMVSSLGYPDLFLMKIDKNGNYINAITIGDSGSVNNPKLAIDKYQNLYLTGSFSLSVDFNPDILLTYYLENTSIAYSSSFILKLDNNFNFIWAKEIESTNDFRNFYSHIQTIQVADDQEVYIAGYFTGEIDFDPGPGRFNLSTCCGFFTDRFIAKYTSLGNLQWAKGIDINGALSYSDEWIYNSTLDSSGNIYCLTQLNATSDLDPSINNYSLTSAGERDGVIAKYDPVGNFIWARRVGGVDFDYLYDLAIKDNNELYITGVFNSNVDLDMSVNVNTYSAINPSNTFVTKLDLNGNYYWSKIINTISGAPLINILHNNSILISGDFSSASDFEIGPDSIYVASNGFSDIFLLTLKNDSCAGYSVNIDTVYDVITDTSFGFVNVSCTNGTAPFNYEWNTIPSTVDSFLYVDTNGIYEITAIDSRGCRNSKSVIFSNVLSNEEYDLTANLILRNNHGAGLNNRIWLLPHNNESLPTNGYLYFIKDPYDTITLLTPPALYTHNDTIVWDFYDLSNRYYHSYPITIDFRVKPIMIDSNYQFQYKLFILPDSTDILPLNNYSEYSFNNFLPHDPNEISVYPKGYCEDGQILGDEDLLYTIKFQNIGSAPAVNVVIYDTLDSSLDMNTFRVVNSSYEPVITEIISGHILKFNFNDINLSDIIYSEPNSHGYISYNIKLKDSLPLGTTIYNKADIYFDYNPPVRTNSVSNIIVDTIINTESAIDTVTLCEGSSYNFNDGYMIRNVLSTHLYNRAFENIFGCDSIYKVYFKVHPTITINDTIVLCYRDSIHIGSHIYTTSGIYKDTFNSFLGCDSIITTNLIIEDLIDTIINITLCNSERLQVGTNHYNSSGLYHDTLISYNGCDSIVLSNLIVLSPINSFTNYNICKYDSVIIGANIYNQSGIYIDTLLSYTNCDSIVTSSIYIHSLNDSIYTIGDSIIAADNTLNYHWINCSNDSLITNQNSYFFYPEISGNYALIVADSFCTDTSDCIYIDVNSILEFNEYNISVYPNPTKGVINIIASIDNFNIKVYNMYSNEITSSNMHDNKLRIDISALTNGMYYLLIYNDKYSKYYKIIKNS